MTRKLTHLLFISDLSVVTASVFFCCYMHSLAIASPPDLSAYLVEWWPMILTAVGVWTILFVHMRLYLVRGGWHFPRMAAELTLAVVLLVTLVLALGYLERQYHSRIVLGLFGPITLLGLIAVRCCVRTFVISKLCSGRARKAVIMGNGHIARELAAKLERHPELMLEVVGFLYPQAFRPIHDISSPVCPTNEHGSRDVTSVGVIDFFRASNIEELIVALPDASASETRKLIALCREQGMNVSLIPQWYELYISKATLVELDGLPIISLQNHSWSPVALLYKRIFDLVAGLFFFLATSPLLVGVAASLFVRRGEAFKSEERCGKNGKPFRMYRFNIDREHADRLLGLERLFAQLSLTELPQLWNVLAGDMSLVGPRPESPDRVRHYSDWQRQRLTICPGLTGLAQVYGLRDQHSSEEKARFDIQYIYDWSPLLDLSLLLQTAWTVAVRLLHSDRASSENPPSVLSAPVPLTEVMRANSTHSGAD